MLYYSSKNCRSGPVKFDEKSKIFKPIGNHSYYFLKWLYDDQQSMTLVGLIESVLDWEISHSVISQKVKNFACPDLSNLTKNRKMTNISENLDIPPESSEQHLDKVLTVIGLIGAGYLTRSIIVQKLQVRTCQVCRKIKNFQSRWKPFILLPKVVIWWSTRYDISRVNLKAFLIDRSPVLW